jgi:hypothetical protein
VCSSDLFVSELITLYEAFVAGRPSPLAELAVQYVDYAAWQQGYLEGQEYQRQLGWWREQLEGVPPVLELPTDRARPAVQTYRGQSVSFELSAELSDSLRQLSTQQGSTLFMTLLAAFEVFLGRYSGQERFCLGTPIAGRNRREVEGLIGFFVNTLVLPSDLSGNPTFAELLGRVRETSLGAYAHQDLPFERLVGA